VDHDVHPMMQLVRLEADKLQVQVALQLMLMVVDNHNQLFVVQLIRYSFETRQPVDLPLLKLQKRFVAGQGQESMFDKQNNLIINLFNKRNCFTMK
jgi:hypothetical protein